MSDSGFDPGLADPARAGVFFVTEDDLGPLAAVGRDAGLLARRIARNFDTLRQQERFGAECRDRFARLGRRWHARARQLAGDEPRSAWQRWLARLGLARE